MSNQFNFFIMKVNPSSKEFHKFSVQNACLGCGRNGVKVIFLIWHSKLNNVTCLNIDLNSYYM